MGTNLRFSLISIGVDVLLFVLWDIDGCCPLWGLTFTTEVKGLPAVAAGNNGEDLFCTPEEKRGASELYAMYNNYVGTRLLLAKMQRSLMLPMSSGCDAELLDAVCRDLYGVDVTASLILAGAINGLNAALWWSSAFFLSSSTIWSTGSGRGFALGADSVSRNFTNSSEKDWSNWFLVGLDWGCDNLDQRPPIHPAWPPSPTLSLSLSVKLSTRAMRCNTSVCFALDVEK